MSSISATNAIRITPRTESEFDKLSSSFKAASQTLQVAQANEFLSAKANVKAAGKSAQGAAISLLGAGMNALLATANSTVGTAQVFKGAGEAVAAGGVATVGAGAFVIEQGRDGATSSLRGLGRGLMALSEAIDNKVLGNENGDFAIQVTPANRDAIRFSQKAFSASSRLIDDSVESFNGAWTSYGDALISALGAGASVAFVVGNAANMAGYLTMAAANVGAGSVVELAQMALEAANVASQAAERGADGVADALRLSAKASFAAANAIKNVDVNGEQVVSVTPETLADFQKQLAAIQAKVAKKA